MAGEREQKFEVNSENEYEKVKRANDADHSSIHCCRRFHFLKNSMDNFEGKNSRGVRGGVSIVKDS